MSSGKTLKKFKTRGRPQAEIDWNKIDSYLRAGCEGASVARLHGIHPETLYDAVERKFRVNFSLYAQTKRAEGVSLMEYSIYLDAMKHGGVDRIFWMKNRANWSDKQTIDQNINFPSLPDIVIKTRDQ